jgi:tetratricopeptide (TPR) repeat protein
MSTKVFFGLCQAEDLCKLYNRYVCQDNEAPAHYISSNQPLSEEKLQLLAGADVVVNHVFNYLQQTETLTRSGLRAKILNFPALSGIYLWPYATEEHINRRYFPLSKQWPYDSEIGDAFLNSLIAANTPSAAAVDQYLSLDIMRAAQVERRTEMLFRQQREREAETEVKVADFIERNLDKADLFMTCEHMGLRLLLHVASQVFELMGCTPASIANLTQCVIRVPDHINQAPVHPSIAGHFRLTASGRDKRYNQFYGRYTFEECCRRYLEYDWNQRLVEGIYFAGQRQDEQALGHLTAGLQMVPDSGRGRNVLGCLLSRAGRYDEALAELQMACELDRRNPDYAIDYGNTLARLCRLDAAVEALQSARVAFPDYPRLNFELSHLLAKQNRHGEACVVAERAVRFSSKRRTMLLHLGRLLVCDQRFDAAIAAGEEAIAISAGDASLLQELARVLLSAGRPLQALEKAREAERLSPADASCHLLSAEILSRLNRLTDAVSAYEKVLSMDPKHRHAHAALSRTLARLDRIEAAAYHGTVAIDLHPDDVHLLAHLGDLYSRLDRLDEAASFYGSAIRLQPGEARFHYHLSRILSRQQKPDLAVDAASRANALSPDNKDYQRYLDGLTGSLNVAGVRPLPLAER